MLPVDEDRKLAFEIARGNQQAVDVLDKRYRSELERVLRRKALPAEDAEDVVQETIIGAVTLIQQGRFRGESSLRTLLFSILRRQAVNYLRKQAQGKAMLFEDSSSEDRVALARIEDIAGPLVKPDTKLMVEEALRALPEEHRLILLMNQLGGYTIEEISSIIRRSRGTVGRILAEAKEMLREKLR